MTLPFPEIGASGTTAAGSPIGSEKPSAEVELTGGIDLAKPVAPSPRSSGGNHVVVDVNGISAPFQTSM